MDDQFLFHDAEYDSSEHRTPNCADAANNRYQENINTGLEGEHVAGVNECVITGVKSTSKASQPGCHSVNPQFRKIVIYSQCRCGILVLFNGTKSETELAVNNE